MIRLQGFIAAVLPMFLLVGCSNDNPGVEKRVPTDEDGDGYVVDEDCDDLDPTVYPGAIEVCDERDQDCDTEIDEGVQASFCLDLDGDGFGTIDQVISACEKPEFYIVDCTDCDDTEILVNPSGTEICDGLDNDCDVEVDESLGQTWYIDKDGDGWGSSEGTTVACSAPPGYVADRLDCNDTDPLINPGASEICNGIDDDCDLSCDEGVKSSWYFDHDGDGYGALDVSCSPPEVKVTLFGDCDDYDSATHPYATDLCDGLDNDCDGDIDEYTGTTWYLDNDADGWGESGSGEESEVDLDGRVTIGGDCDDANPDIHPQAGDPCNGLDDDCDGTVDNGSRWRDLDGDGWGDSAAPVPVCKEEPELVDNDEDCDDADPTRNPEASEVAGNGLDEDCDGFDDLDLSTHSRSMDYEYMAIEDGSLHTYYRFATGLGDTDGDGYGNVGWQYSFYEWSVSDNCLENYNVRDIWPRLSPGETYATEGGPTCQALLRGFPIGDTDADGLDEAIIQDYMHYVDTEGPELIWLEGSETETWASSWTFRGVSLDSAGDFNGTGLPGLLVGEPNSIGYGAGDFGVVHVIPGPIGPWTTFDGEIGAMIQGEESESYVGELVAGDMDLDGDGLDDIAVFGERSKIAIFRGPIEGTLTFRDADTLIGAESTAESFPWMEEWLRSGGDNDGDGLDDLVISLGRSELLVLHGPIEGDGIGCDHASLVDDADSVTFQVSRGAEVDGDGFADILVTSGERVWLALGPLSGTEFLDDHIVMEPFGTVETVDLAPDIDGDGLADLAISDAHIYDASTYDSDYYNNSVYFLLSSELF